MLLNDFYTIQAQNTEDDKVNATLIFDKNHSIFNGHFPGRPVVPGVCMLMLVKEVMSSVQGRPMVFNDVPQMKFLTMIDPNLHPEVDLLIDLKHTDDGNFLLDATLKKEQIIFFKMKARFTGVSSVKDLQGS